MPAESGHHVPMAAVLLAAWPSLEVVERMAWPRPVPTVGDPTSAAERQADPRAWAMTDLAREALASVIVARRDVRRYRPEAVAPELLERVLIAAHAAPSVGHSQPWRFVVVRDAATRARAAVMADRARIAQAALMDPDSGHHLLDLDLEGIREAPVGIVVCCDRRTPAAGVLGRATFSDADMWSCACAIENLWLAARAEGLGVGWVTLFQPGELADLVGAPQGVETLGWLCIGWPDERPPAPGLERRGWSQRLPLGAVVLEERWPSNDPPPPVSRLAAPPQAAFVAAHDSGDELLTPAGSLGLLDRSIDRACAARADLRARDPGVLLLAVADHPVTALGVSAYPPSVTRHVTEATLAGRSVGAVAARQADLETVVVDAGLAGPAVPGTHDARPREPRGDLVASDALSAPDATALFETGARLAEERIRGGAALIALGEAGVGNTTPAAALAASLLGLTAEQVAGLGAGSDSAIVAAKRRVIAAALERCGPLDPLAALRALGGGELALLAGAATGAAAAGGVVVLDGLATSVAALVACRVEPAVQAHLIASHCSREPAHRLVLGALGLEPLLELRMRAGEGAGAAFGVGLLRAGLAVRFEAARTRPGQSSQAQPGSDSWPAGRSPR